MSSKNQPKNLNNFTKYYKKIYGEERWDLLVTKLRRPTRHCMIINEATSSTASGIQLQDWIESQLSRSETDASNNEQKKYSTSAWVSRYWPQHLLAPLSIKAGKQDVGKNTLAFPAPCATEKDDMLTHYLLDAASLLPVIALDVNSNDHILDLCGAPGGKSVIIGQTMLRLNHGETPNTGSLHTNEIHRGRYDRMRGVLNSYFGNSRFIKTSNLDGTMYGHFGTFRYDKILVDAPCSSERHLLQNPAEMQHWSLRDANNNAQRQLKLLLSALQLVKPGGRIVYSTCALTPEENDQVIGNLLARRGDILRVVKFSPPNLDWGEATTHGWHCLPDNSAGWGPIYLSILEKLELVDTSDSE